MRTAIVGVQHSSVGLTPRLKTCKTVIETSFELGFGAPSFDVIREAMGVRSKASVHKLVHGLADRGHLVMRGDQIKLLLFTADTADFFSVERINGEAVLRPLKRRAA